MNWRRFRRKPSPPQETGRKPAPTDAEISQQSRLLDLEQKAAQLEKEWDALETERENRRLRKSVAVGALLVMALQIVVANGIFVWYGETNGWDIPAGAISAWLGSTVVQIVAVVLVIMKYLFPEGGPREPGKK